MRKQNGFSLIELLIVVAIILIIAATAIPNLLRSHIAANEASAVGSLRTIDTAQITYASTFPNLGCATSLSVLGPGSTSGNTTSTSANAVLLDGVLGCATATASGGTCTKSGFSFYLTDTGASPTFYASNANPISAQTGTRHFYSDATGVIRYNTTTSATSTDSPLQ
jgi:prepilin-type N-terminal cleavage/methylation domain-containing protein